MPMFTICKKSVTIDGRLETVYGVKSDKIIFDDVSPNINEVERLLALLNGNDIDSEHLTDVIEDFVAAN